MLELIKRMDGSPEVNAIDTLILPYELRIRGRLKAVTDNGRDAGLFLDRGPVLRHGDLLQARTGEVIRISAANEPVTTAYISNGLPLTRLCYHLGNRHVSLAIGVDEDGRHWVRFPPDHVLEELAELLGASLLSYMAGFVVATLAITFVGRRLGELMLRADNRVTRALGGVVAVVGGVLAAG